MEDPFCPVHMEIRVSAEGPLQLLASLPPKWTLIPSPNHHLLLPPDSPYLPANFTPGKSQVPHSSADTLLGRVSRWGSALLAASPCLWISLSTISHEDFTLGRWESGEGDRGTVWKDRDRIRVELEGSKKKDAREGKNGRRETSK